MRRVGLLSPAYFELFADTSLFLTRYGTCGFTKTTVLSSYKRQRFQSVDAFIHTKFPQHDPQSAAWECRNTPALSRGPRAQRSTLQWGALRCDRRGRLWHGLGLPFCKEMQKAQASLDLNRPRRRLVPSVQRLRRSRGGASCVPRLVALSAPVPVYFGGGRPRDADAAAASCPGRHMIPLLGG
jgi:hypothetical protein